MTVRFRRPRKSHLEQTESFTGTHVELRDDGPVLLTLPHGDNVHQRLTTQDDACGVNARLAFQPLVPLRYRRPSDVRFGIVEIAELARLGITG